MDRHRLHCPENIGAYDDGQNERSGSILVNRIESLICDRNIYAEIEVLGSALSTDPDLEYLEVTGTNAEFWGDGNLSANITAVGTFDTSDGIGSIVVFGAIGSIDGHGVSIDSGDDIVSIFAGSLSDMFVYAPGKDVHSLVARGYQGMSKVLGGGWGGDPVIEYGVPIGDPEPDPVPDEYTDPGTLECRQLREFAVVGNMESNITVTAAPNSGNVWKIGRSLREGATISLDGDEDLTHQIIINQQNVGGEWDGTITVGSTTLEPLYEERPDEIGDGAAGVIDFRMHETGCVPINDSLWPSGEVDITSIEEPPPCNQTLFDVKIHYYGKIEQEESGCAVRVWKHSMEEPWEFFEPPGTGWTEITSSLFSHASGGRDLTIAYSSEQTWEPGYMYWIEVQEETVLCLTDEEMYAPVDPVYVAPHAYWFILYDNCEELFDRNSSGFVSSPDLAIQLTTPRDYDESGTTEWRDTAIMLRWMSEHPE